MSKSIFNSDVFNSKNINNSNDLPDLNITDLIADTATIGTLTNTELQAATSGVANNATNLTGITYATSGDLTTIDNNVSVTGTITNTGISSLSSQQTTNTNNIATITHTVNGIAYEETPDRTTISNGVIIEKELDGNNPQQLLLVAPTNNTATILSLLGQESSVSGISNGRNCEILLGNNLSGSTKFIGSISTTLTDATNNLGDVVFNSINNTTRTEYIRLKQSGQIDLKKNTEIDGNLTLTSGKVLAIPNYSNVETTLTSLSTQQSTNTNAIAALADVTNRFVVNPATTITVSNDFVAAGAFYHTPRMVRYNFDKDAATNNLWGGDNVANDIRQTRQTGTSFVSSTGSGLITVSVAGFYRIKYQATVENDGQNGRITVGAYLRHGTTLYWKDDDRGFFGAAYIRDDDEGTMGSFGFEDYLDLAANDQLSFPTKLNLGTNSGFTDTTAQANLDWFSMVELELIKLA